MIDFVLKSLGYGSLDQFVDDTMEEIEEERSWFEHAVRLANRDQIKKFNKRKKQRRAYCGGRK